MLHIIKQWFDRYFSDPEAIFLTLFSLAVLVIFMTMGNILVPIIASIIIAYMLNGFVDRLKRWKFPHLLAVTLVYFLFIAVIIVIFIWIVPLLTQQLGNFFAEIPHMLNRGQKFLISLQTEHKELFSADQLQRIISEFNRYLTQVGQFLFSYSLASIANVITIAVYVILVPLLVFFFLKDKRSILEWLGRFLPEKRSAITKIWCGIDDKIGDYIRGKFIEVIIVALVSAAVFAIMGLHYAVLLGVFVGFSVIIPYVGAIVVTIPVVVVALLEWGVISPHFLYLLIIYAIIITLDANVLVPILFSETMQLHPVVIILAVLVFGAIGGFWGVFFAIPLATLVNALLKGWPVTKNDDGV